MPVRDNLHDIVKSALIKDGWRITHDPLFIGYADVRVYVDLGAERPIAAEKEDEKIAVEVKSFVGRSAVQDFEHAKIPYSYGELERLAIYDNEQDSYMLVDVGWERNRRIHNVVFHLRIRDDKIWVEDDWTEYGVAQELVDAGIPKDEIVLGFQPVEKRPFTEFAVG